MGALGGAQRLGYGSGTCAAGRGAVFHHGSLAPGRLVDRKGRAIVETGRWSRCGPCGRLGSGDAVRARRRAGAASFP